MMQMRKKYIKDILKENPDIKIHIVDPEAEFEQMVENGSFGPPETDDFGRINPFKIKGL